MEDYPMRHTQAKTIPLRPRRQALQPTGLTGEILRFEPRVSCAPPLFLNAVAAGFPSPADDFVDKALDLNEHLIDNATATYFVRAAGDSMIDAGIHDNDVLIVDRSRDPKQNDVVIAALDGELTVKRLRKQNGEVWLLPENPTYKPIRVHEDMGFELWGVVTYVIHAV